MESPVAETGGYVVLLGCRPHGCYHANAAILVSSDLKYVHAVRQAKERVMTYSENVDHYPRMLADALTAAWLRDYRAGVREFGE